MIFLRKEKEEEFSTNVEVDFRIRHSSQALKSF